MKEQWILFGIAAGVCFLLTALLGKIIIPKLKNKKIEQVIYRIRNSRKGFQKINKKENKEIK